MVIDTSALIAILLNESDGIQIFQAMKRYSRPGSRYISTANLLEAYTVIYAKKGIDGIRELELLQYKSALNAVPFTTDMIAFARDGWIKYGKLSGHPAKLNFGDCFSYALAKKRDEPLLFKGDDFNHTDVKIVPV